MKTTVTGRSISTIINKYNIHFALQTCWKILLLCNFNPRYFSSFIYCIERKWYLYIKCRGVLAIITIILCVLAIDSSSLLGCCCCCCCKCYCYFGRRWNGFLSFGFNLFCFNLFHVFDVIKYATVFKVFNLFIVI